MIPIMLVEDEFLVRVGLKTCISWNDIGYEVVAEAKDGETAVERYKETRPKLIITDIKLPHMSGLDVMTEIRSMDTKVRFIIISAFDDFKIAQKAIGIGVEGYFIKGSLDTDELTEMLEEMKRKYFQEESCLERETISKQSFREIYLKGDFLEKGDSALKMRIVNEELYVVLFQVEVADSERFAEMIHVFLGQQVVSHQFWVENSVSWFFVSPGDYNVYELMEKIETMVKRYVQSGLQIGISKNYYDNRELKDTIYEALLAAGSLLEEKSVVMEHYQGKPMSDVQTRNILKRIEELLHMQRYNEAGAEIENLEKLLRVFYSTKSFYYIIYKLVGILAEYDEEIYRYHDILELLNLRKIFQCLQERITNIRTETGNITPDNVYISNAKAYVYSNYQTQINISAIAQAVHVSANYLGKIFLNGTGEYLTDFINKVKIEKSKELLAEHKYSISEVAMRVGVSDQRYFSKLFKKYYGMTPKEYANQVYTNY